MQIEDFKRNNPNWEKSFVEESESFAHFVERTEEASYGRRSSLFCCYEGPTSVLSSAAVLTARDCGCDLTISGASRC
jgi:hypothetical protein